MSKENGRHQTRDQGELQALELAICTLVRVLPEPTKQAFITAYSQNVENWDDTALPSTSISDEWLAGMRDAADGLLRIVRQP